MLLSGLAVGIVLGAVMQRGRFCVTGMLRDIVTLKSWRGIVALLIVISVHAVGIAALTSAGIITPKVSDFAPAAVMIGSLVFGVGIVLAGGCASGTWYRSGEGLVGSWLALVGYGLSAAAMKRGPLASTHEALANRTVKMTTLPETLGISVWWFALGLSALTIYLVNFYLQRDNMRGSKVRLEQPWWARSLHLYTAGALVGIIGVIAWPLSAATGRNSGLGITTPSADLFSYLTTGNLKFLNWGTLLVLGILVGSYLAAKAAGEFRVRLPDAVQAQRSVIGGVMMGVGASWAGGCTVGNGMVQTSLFSYQGWVALLFTGLGVALAAKVFLKPTQNTEVPTSAPVAEPSLTAEPKEFAFATAPVALKVRTEQQQGLRQIAPATYALDTLGAVCPFPLVDARAAMSNLQSGDSLVIDFDCTQATETIPQWASDEGYAVTDFRRQGNAGWQITVRKS
ncbi:YeeE/YedE thiosulfate transporter family protein [Corynebacterium epidermidicanis]|uniref:Putative redox protein, regulator of disulfide bond formation n=1 Tax=Corynebacterium epidermidicanis TaxID=1050174 RepID=A0A0G3GW01_9CORY|nr:YeeE/YedE thiosulfate transporter family protein [Corynebacterium epidermidicanis]AKK03683.1 putative redox protein, regulator of disulfide bond formation [Corynebacterium epidermidicanis]